MTSSRPTLKFNLPTILTLSRIVLIPLFIFEAQAGRYFWAAIIFSIASITDFLDGYLARRTGQVTTFGIIIDPIADKFLVIAALFQLVEMERIEVWIAVVIVVREFFVTALRVVALAKDIVIKAEMGGKWKTGMQITAVICLMVGKGTPDMLAWDSFVWWLTDMGINVYNAGTLALWISLVLAVISGVQYIAIFWRRLQGAAE